MKDYRIQRMLRYRWLIFTLLALAYVFVYFHRFALSIVALDIERAFKTSASIIGVLGSGYFYAYALMQFPAGLLSDSLGPRKCVTFFLAIASLGSILFGLSVSVKLAILFRIIVGIGVSVVFIPTMKILSQWYFAREFSTMAGIMNAMGGIGMLISTAPLALMSSRIGWRNSFILIGGITALIALFSWLIIRDKPRDKGWPSIAEIENGGNVKHVNLQSIPLMEGVKRVFRDKYFWPLAFWFFFDCGVFFGFGALWSGPYLMHVYGMKQSEAGLILSMIAFGMVAGSPLMSILSDRVFKSRKRVLILSSTGLVLDLLLLCLMPDGLPKPLLFVVFFLFSVFSSAIVVIGFTTTKELFPVEIAGTSIGAVNLFPFLGGAVFQPALGYVLDKFPKSSIYGYPVKAYSAMLLLLLGIAVLALICTFLTKDTFYDHVSVSSENSSS